MNHAEIKERIQHNLDGANLDTQEVRVQPDPFSGWRIAVIAEGFADKTYEQRKQIVVPGLEDINIEWLDLLTPQEREWAGVLPIDSSLEDLPLWPEALARSRNPENVECKEIVFASDLDEDLERPIVATFYSFRGGVGRSTALAYTARILASRNRTVLCVDMDLEAPGLAALFGKEAQIEPGQGLLSLLLELDRGDRPRNIANHLLRLSETEDLYCLPGGIPDANYARKLNFIDPGAWYREERNPLRDLMDMLASELPFRPDVILLDARTGIAPLNAPLLFDLADLAIVSFFPHPQTLTGTEALVRALLAARTRRVKLPPLTPEPRFLISPIPASKAPEVVERYQHRAIEWISEWLSVVERDRSEAEPMIPSEIAHFVPYREAIATSDRIMGDRDIWQDFEPIAEWLERFLPAPSEQRFPDSVSDAKSQILKELSFSGGTAEVQNNFLETFVDAGVVTRALNAEIPLVLGRKGTGKTAIFRRLMEGDRRSAVVLSPAPLRGDRLWVMSAEGFKIIENTLRQTGSSWRDFWIVQTCLACYLSEPERYPQPDDALAELLGEKPDTEKKAVRLVQKLLELSEIGLLAKDWLNHIDRASSPPTLLLCDGLDTGFGNTQTDRKRRKQAIEGLFSWVTDMGDNLQSLKFKIVLREDIWRQLQFENKSHFFGRSVTLQWTNRIDYLKVALKQALLSPTFREISKSILGSQFLPNHNYWMDEQVIQLWNLLVGERMRGGKSTFTRTWVWKRLADGSDNHSPRTLLQLFRVATEWEQRENSRNPYRKTIIRPRALIASLEEVSKQALDALVNEEFPELNGLIDQLQALGRSPLETNKLSNLDEELTLAREVGLISVYEGTEDNVQRYKVPDLYRLGIGMTRKGQA